MARRPRCAPPLGITDTAERSRLSDFERDLNVNVARALNAHYGRGENLWRNPGSYDNTEVHTSPDLEDQLCYVWAQVVKDGLVETPEGWEGVRLLPEDIGRTFVIPKPEGAFFGSRKPKGWEPTYGPAREELRRLRRRLRQEARRRMNARDRARGPSRRRRRRKEKERAPRPVRHRSTLPEQVKLTISPPPGYEHMSLDEVRAYFRSRLDAYLGVVMAEREAEGVDELPGHGRDRGRGPARQPGRHVPHLRPQPADRLQGPRAARGAPRRARRLARERPRGAGRWKDGDRSATFPYGTYWMVRFHGASCERAPPA